MSEFASYAVKRARKYVFGKSKQYVQTKVKQAVQAVERKAAQTIKRTAEAVVDKVTTKRQKTMPSRGLIMAAGANNRRRGVKMTRKNGRRRKFSRALRKRRSGYNGNSLKRAMRKIALDASETKRHLGGTGTNLSSGDITFVNMDPYLTKVFALTSGLKADVPTGIPTFNGDHFFLKGINIAGQVSNNSATGYRIGVRLFIFKDEVSGFDYTTLDAQVSQELLWYNRNTGAGSSFLALPEPFKGRPRLMKGQNAKMVWSKYYELDYSSAGGGLNTSDAATFNKYLPVNREMRLKTQNQNRPQCQWWLGCTWHKLDMEEQFNAPTQESLPLIGFTSTVYFKDP